MRAMSAAVARRTAVAAQGFADRPASTPATRRSVLRVLDRTQLLQIDSVSAVVRAHYAPIFSRIGSYDRSLIDDAAWQNTSRKPRRLVEYWAHEAALIPVEDWPLMRWRMTRYIGGRWGGAQRVLDRNPTLAGDVLDVIADAGPCSAGDVERHLDIERPDRKGPWWDRSDTKMICEQLFAVGGLSVDKRVGFTRHYELTERVLPPEIVARQVNESDAVRELVLRSARALGIATEPDLRDYYRLHRSQTEPAIADLIDEGVLEPVTVTGWKHQAYLFSDARTPRQIAGSALLCPFDPLVFFRPRTERIFDFHFRIEIYTPEHKRVHGYYVFPFLLDGELVGRVDLRADRAASRLTVPGAFAEPGRVSAYVVTELAAALRALADWLELDDIVIGNRGDLAAPLAREFRNDVKLSS
ncbi:winged helix-turn-helix domain-containing protein [Antrihabitans cavernicola]|uniref:Winged helix-turn-helix domain-containing protein n=1 Tax=Antrihabitans cavernicola TaxID=2495913 RepID=A0A5A7SAY6_9NOCA|nr:crosslink repair DNA glycosylase YcaQ family protein [Spelaeibacter cavernicola]KAA0023310.1 winged helix-turn-helix domain-containing protein [Spelaeibacter cavernicola]